MSSAKNSSANSYRSRNHRYPVSKPSSGTRGPRLFLVFDTTDRVVGAWIEDIPSSYRNDASSAPAPPADIK